MKVLIVLGVAFLPLLLTPAQGGSVKEDWNYVSVRKNANMFWWLYYADHPTKNYTQVPLVMWLQGGPGASGCGFGNFGEIGPLDTNLNPRNSSWVQVASLLFVDNPVGTGYSYTTDGGAFAKDVDAVSGDMLVLLKELFLSKPEFQTIPFYIFSESYGGKMAAAISLALHKAVLVGDIKCNFGGVALGDSWISPIDSVVSWGPYLYSISLLDENGLKAVQKAADSVQDALNKEQYEKATELWSMAEDVIEENTDGVNFYNILTKDSLMSGNHVKSNLKFHNPALGSLYRRHILPLQTDGLSELMNGPIRAKLKIIPDSVTWGGQSAEVFTSMAGDFMRPVVSVVDELLCAGINVTVYNGQLDLIVDTVGQEGWVKQLKWKKLDQFKSLRWTPLHLQSTETAAFYKTWENFGFYWILKAGHMVPSDQPETSLKVLRMITKQEK
ncbi:PREDICTED: retinoid-inducible serine carboxypeptidase [Nanorana parkeri]|uniref:retinoid-inducible serine carboxypeptidase n=1 Tax=Nanorana parkeri TaxID=125878 RepID=UPI0008547FCC|nr:PREDICTED: retinoid-inducible serine carboxypeptidase [Nanorana parkeri]